MGVTPPQIAATEPNYKENTTAPEYMSQEFQPMASQLSKKAALPLAKIFATCRNNVGNTGPISFAKEFTTEKGCFPS